jgi:feruloyl esterase
MRGFLFLLLAGSFAWGTPCADLAALTIPDVAIRSAAAISATTDLPAYCRVVLVATPTSDSVINIEVWIPAAQAWNGKFQGVGNNGFQGAIAREAMVAALRRGYATASTDTGHNGGDLRFGDGHPEKIEDWAYRAIHVMTQTAQLIIRDHLGRFPQYSYFDGCNTGGHQALMEAQRYPHDYDGIIAGDPAADRVHEVIGYLWAWTATHQDGRSMLSPAKLQFVTKAVVGACDALDGVKDQVIEDPRRCHFDPATLACRASQTQDCLTPAEIGALKKVYDGARNPRTGNLIFRGWSPGSEGFGDTANEGWSNFINIPEPRRVDFFKYFVFHNPNWDWNTMDWDRDAAYADAKIGFIDATSRDLSGFRSRRGKLLMYTGWDDPILPPLDIVDYYEAVARNMGGVAKTSEFFRLYMVPGMGHCNGGPGTTNFDMLPALEQWVEKKIPPARVVASRRTKGAAQRTRPLCPYPSVAQWKGSGSTDEAANFVCAAPPGAKR